MNYTVTNKFAATTSCERFALFFSHRHLTRTSALPTISRNLRRLGMSHLRPQQTAQANGSRRGNCFLPSKWCSICMGLERVPHGINYRHGFQVFRRPSSGRIGGTVASDVRIENMQFHATVISYCQIREEEHIPLFTVSGMLSPCALRTVALFGLSLEHFCVAIERLDVNHSIADVKASGTRDVQGRLGAVGLRFVFGSASAFRRG